MIIGDLFENDEIEDKYAELLSVIDFDIIHKIAEIYSQSFLVDPAEYDEAYQQMLMQVSNRSKRFAKSRLRKALRSTSDLSMLVAAKKRLKTKLMSIDALNETFNVIDDHHWRQFILSGFKNSYQPAAIKVWKYRDPNGMKYRTYMLACHIYRCLLDIQLTIDDVNDLILYKHPANNVLTVIERADIASFTRFLVKYIAKERKLSKIVCKAVNIMISNKDNSFKDIEFYQSASTNQVIQFKDCYLEKGEFFAGQYRFIPSYWIDRCVWSVVQNGQPSKVVSVVDDLLFNICNDQSFDMEVLLSRLSTFMLNDSALKKRINFAPRAVVIYDKHDKSNADALMGLLREAVGEINCVSQMIKDFGTSRLDYFRERSARALIIADTAGMQSRPSQKSKELMGYFMQGNEVRTGSTAKSYRKYFANASVISYTHSTRALVDTELDDCVEWRFEIFPKSYRSTDATLKTREWFKVLESDEAAQYLLESLVLIHLDNVERHKLLRRDYKRLSELDKV